MKRKNTNDSLISTIYSAALAPEKYDAFMDSIEKHLFDGVNTGQDLDKKLKTELNDHFKTAYALQKKMGRHRKQTPWAEALVQQVPGFALVFNADEQIVACNQIAQMMFGKSLRTLADFNAPEQQLDKLRLWMHDLSANDTFTSPACNININCNGAIIIRKVKPGSGSGPISSFHDHDSRTCFLVTGVEMDIDDVTQKLLNRTYGLTVAEGEIASLLAAGRLSSEIAEQRQVSLNTIRSQIKSIQRKMQAKGVPDIVRLVCGFTSALAVSYQASHKIQAPKYPHCDLQRKASFTLRDGRHMAFSEQGAKDGMVVLCLHNMLYGTSWPVRAVAAAKRQKIRIISPARPGYGSSDLLQNAFGDELLNAVANDMCELLDHLGIQKAQVLGLAIGSVYALRFARLFPNRVSGLFATGHAPIWRDHWLEKLPRRQRLIAQITKNLPALLPLVTRAGAALMDAGYKNKFIDALHHDTPADVIALEQAEIREVVLEGLDFTIAQGTEAFRRDCIFAITDFCDEARRLAMPFHFIHGEDDKVVPLSNIQEFIKEVPGSDVEMVKNAGQFVLLSHWQYVLKTLQEN